jgi:hypothetical protein
LKSTKVDLLSEAKLSSSGKFLFNKLRSDYQNRRRKPLLPLAPGDLAGLGFSSDASCCKAFGVIWMMFFATFIALARAASMAVAMFFSLTWATARRAGK